MSCACGVSALLRPARMRGPCSAHAIPRAGQLVAGHCHSVGYSSHQLPCARESTRAARQPPPTRDRHASAARPVRPRASRVDASQRQRAARQELGVPAFRAYPSGLQTLMETAAVCADNLRTCRKPVLGEFRLRCMCMQRHCYAYLLGRVCGR